MIRWLVNQYAHVGWSERAWRAENDEAAYKVCMMRAASAGPRRVWPTLGTMTAATFRRALARLDWTQAEAARQLGASSAARVSDWHRGVRPVPPYIAAHVRTHLAQLTERNSRNAPAP